MGGVRYQNCDKCHIVQYLGCKFCTNCGNKLKENSVSFYEYCIANNLEYHTEWSPNNTLKPNEISFSSAKKFLFICKNNHEYSCQIDNKIRGRGCPYCAGKKVLIGYNDLGTTNPEISNEWNYNKNILSPTHITIGSGKKVWWICANKHEWVATISSRTKSNCPICGNKKVLFGFNDVSTTHPDLLKFWDFEKNIVKPTEITYGYSKDVWWKCEYGHSYNATIPEIINGNRCSYCSGHKVLIGFNDLWTTHPKICEELENKEDGYRYSQGSNKKINWICSNKHKYNMMINAKTNGLGCPYCSNQRILEGFNDIKTTHPNILNEWDYDKNTIDPSKITYGYDKQVYWICEKCQFSWKTQVYRRVSKNPNGCPKCKSSKGEKKVLKILNKYHVRNKKEKTFKGCKDKSLLRFDFYLLDYNICVEFQGIHHYPNECKSLTHLKPKRYNEQSLEIYQLRDKIKKDFCKKENIKLVEIPYYEFDNIEDILIKELNLNKI